MTTREHLINRAYYWVTDPRGGGAVPARFIGGYRCADGHEMKPYFRTVDGEIPLSEVSAIGDRLVPSGNGGTKKAEMTKRELIDRALSEESA